MKFLLIVLLLLSATAYSQKKDSTVIKLTSWQLEQVQKFDATAKEIETAAQVNESNRQTFFKAVIGRDITPADSVTYSPPRIVIYKRKSKAP